mmetsp:Transcript_61437/g.187643  ORF Transcript_61437/g.187643 Transcript_61437/m.187643 type:complete len:88 (-) Transcript_61437:197-460(-)
MHAHVQAWLFREFDYDVLLRQLEGSCGAATRVHEHNDGNDHNYLIHHKVDNHGDKHNAYFDDDWYIVNHYNQHDLNKQHDDLDNQHK